MVVAAYANWAYQVTYIIVFLKVCLDTLPEGKQRQAVTLVVLDNKRATKLGTMLQDISGWPLYTVKRAEIEA
jgi:hypothetical protein